MPNRNLSHASNFILITNTLSEDILDYSIQSCNLPGLSMGNIAINGSSVKGYLQADTITYSDLTVDIIISENLGEWIEIISRFQKMRNPESDTGENIEHYVHLLIYDDTHTKELVKLVFKNARVSSISDIQLSSISSDEELTTSITFNYDYYSIEL